jgi:hypothetical protein
VKIYKGCGLDMFAVGWKFIYNSDCAPPPPPISCRIRLAACVQVRCPLTSRDVKVSYFPFLCLLLFLPMSHYGVCVPQQLAFPTTPFPKWVTLTDACLLETTQNARVDVEISS